ncbi:MAG TPA: archaellum operon transcriptional activator EarA family protein [Candidatus Paceibacterota bacterium]|nr:archaellum operon transcriptional activator EarA family protein [Candidatus Paceibacterota bacterium]
MSKPILDNLFGSKVRVKILKFLFRNHEADFSVTELARRIQEPYEATKKEIELLRGIKIIVKKN